MRVMRDRAPCQGGCPSPELLVMSWHPIFGVDEGIVA